MTGGEVAESRDLARLSVPFVGQLVATRDPWAPYRLEGADGVPVEAVADYLRDLQARGRPEVTARSYGLDLLRWFRFLLCTSQGEPSGGPGLLALAAGRRPAGASALAP